MKKLIVFGAGSFGKGLMESVRACTGLEPDEDTYVLDGSDIQKFRSSLGSICNSVYKNDSLLLLADQQNSPIVQEAYLVLEKKGLMHRMVMMTGANVGMLAAVMRMKERITGNDQLARVLKAEGESGIQAVFLKQ